MRRRLDATEEGHLVLPDEDAEEAEQGEDEEGFEGDAHAKTPGDGHWFGVDKGDDTK